MRKPNESIFQAAVRTAYETGHLWHVKQEDLHLLQPSDQVFIDAMISMTRMDSSRYTRFVLREHGRLPDFDGIVGPAIAAMVSEEGGRCWVPDIAPPPDVSFQFEDPALQLVTERMQLNAVMEATGSGNWKQCHNVGDFHCAAIGVNDSGIPSFLRPVFLDVLKNVQRSYAGVGLLFRFIRAGKDMITGEAFNGNINSDFSFVSSSSGWIGLAIVGQGETCGSKIWCKYLSTYRGGHDNVAIITQWTTLIKHELGHNCGRGHTNGGVMNPSIVNGLPVEWGTNDPSTSWLKGQFGGVPVPIPGGGPTPAPPSPPDNSVEERLRALELKTTIHEIAIHHLVTRN